MATIGVYELFDIIEGNYQITATNKNDDTVVVISSASAISYIKHKFGTRRYKVLRGSTPTKADATSDLQEDFTRYLSNRQHNIDVLYQGLYEELYNPTENVFEDVNESVVTNDDLSHGHTLTKTGTDTTTYNTQDAKTGNDADAHTGTQSLNHGEAGYNQENSYSPLTQDATTYNDTMTTRYNSQNAKTGTETLAHNTVDTDGGTDERDIDTTTTRSRHGNVGTIASSELLEREIELRLKSFAEMLIDNFINDFTFYS